MTLPIKSNIKKNYLDVLNEKQVDNQVMTPINKPKINLFDFSQVKTPTLNLGMPVSGNNIINIGQTNFQKPIITQKQNTGFSLIPTANADETIVDEEMIKQFIQHGKDLGKSKEEINIAYTKAFNDGIFNKVSQQQEQPTGFNKLGFATGLLFPGVGQLAQGINNIKQNGTFEKIGNLGKNLKFDYSNELIKSKNPIVSSFGNLVESLKFAGNIPGDTIQFVGGLGEMITKPIETSKSLKTLSESIVETGLNKLTGQDYYTTEEKRAMSEGIGKALKDNFGSLELIRKTITENPVDFLMTLQGGLGLTKGLTNNVNTIAKIDKINEIISPINMLKTEYLATKQLGKGIVNKTGDLGAQILGKTTGTSAETIKTAFKQGGTQEFQSALKGETTAQDILGGVKQGLEDIRIDKNKLYGEGAKILQLNKKEIHLNDIQQKLTDVIINDYKVKILDNGKLDFSQSKITGNTSKANIQAMYDDLITWQDKTPDGLDTLKQRIQDYYRGVDDSGKADRLSTILSNNIKDKIINEVPEYKAMVGNYEKVTNDLRDITKTLSLGKEAQAQTSITKLNSILRDNFTARQDVVKLIEQYTGRNIQGQVAGASLNPMLARGLAGVITGGGIVFGQLTNPAFWAGLAVASPRLIGEMANIVGVTSNKIKQFITNIKKYANPNKPNITLNNMEGSPKKLIPTNKNITSTLLKPKSQKLLPAKGDTTKTSIITPQTKDKGVIFESKKGLENTKMGKSIVGKTDDANKSVKKNIIKPNKEPKIINKTPKKEDLLNEYKTKTNIEREEMKKEAPKKELKDIFNSFSNQEKDKITNTYNTLKNKKWDIDRQIKAVEEMNINKEDIQLKNYLLQKLKAEKELIIKKENADIGRELGIDNFDSNNISDLDLFFKKLELEGQKGKQKTYNINTPEKQKNLISDLQDLIKNKKENSKSFNGGKEQEYVDYLINNRYEMLKDGGIIKISKEQFSNLVKNKGVDEVYNGLSNPTLPTKPKTEVKLLSKIDTKSIKSNLENLSKSNIDEISKKISPTHYEKVKEVITRYIKEFGEDIKNYIGLLADDISQIVGGKANLLGGEKAKLFDKSRWQEAKEMTRIGKQTITKKGGEAKLIKKDPLIEKARKYKSAEEFFKAGETDFEIQKMRRVMNRNNRRLSPNDFGGENKITLWRTSDKPISAGDYVYTTKEEAQRALKAGQGKKLFSKVVNADEVIDAGPGGEFFYGPKEWKKYDGVEDFWRESNGLPINKKQNKKQSVAKSISDIGKMEMEALERNMQFGKEEFLSDGITKDIAREYNLTKSQLKQIYDQAHGKTILKNK